MNDEIGDQQVKAKANAGDQVFQLDPRRLTPWAKNARKHSKKQVQQIAESIRTFGFTNPVLIDQNHTILAGHGRVAAAMSLEMDAVPCLYIEHLTPEQKRAICIG